MSFQEIFKSYNDKVQFIMVYIREAHPVEGWWFGKGLTRRMIKFYSPKTSVETYDPKTDVERQKVARQCENTLKYGIRTCVDTIDDKVSKAYAARPTRIYLVGIDGKVVYRGGLGPFGFKPNDFKKAIKDYLGTIKI
ncbi:MAG: hypothetical protein JRJ27_08995 [Deltaproteobacteria bacterium]|nr:hypothetical protein [Deltaproteobacteria bacterium]